MQNLKKALTMAIMGIVLFPLTNHAQSWLTNGLVAYYPFNGDANDASGNGNNLQQLGGAFTSNRFGSTQSAIEFSSLLFPLSGNLYSTQIQTPGNNFSICVWFKTLESNAIIGLGSAQTTQSFQNDRWLNVTPDGGMQFFVYPGHPESIYTTNIVTDNQWHSAVATLSSAGMRIYLDGTLVASNPNVTSAQASSGYWHTGYHIGQLDDIRIYNRALSVSEVQQLYVYESGPRVNLIKAVKPSFSNMSLGTNYQLQVSGNLNNWTNQGSAFTATNTSMIYPQYWDVDGWGSLFFRLQVMP